MDFLAFIVSHDLGIFASVVVAVIAACIYAERG